MSVFNTILYILFAASYIFQNFQASCEVIPSANETSSKNTSTPTDSAKTTTISQELNVAEGGSLVTEAPVKVSSPADTTHMGREHMIKADITKQNQTVSKDVTELPNYVTAEKNDNRKSVPKKGVESQEAASSASEKVTPKVDLSVIPIAKKKPLLTDAIDDDVLPSNPDPKTKSNKTVEPNKQIPSIESVLEIQVRNQRKADYVVPIVAVILSVPLLAIIISVSYKRGAEWWQHRHYRRMDFLIDGMYNN